MRGWCRQAHRQLARILLRAGMCTLDLVNPDSCYPMRNIYKTLRSGSGIGFVKQMGVNRDRPAINLTAAAEPPPIELLDNYQPDAAPAPGFEGPFHPAPLASLAAMVVAAALLVTAHFLAAAASPPPVHLLPPPRIRPRDLRPLPPLPGTRLGGLQAGF